ncbi:MAG: hypothetical protein WBL92_05365, partial [Methanothrix sp.]
DRDVWERFNKSQGQMKIDDTQYESSFSCKLVRNPKLSKGDTYCKNTEFGNCAFYRCRCKDRKSYQDWLQHHEEKHPEETHLYISCNECDNIRKKEVGFMNYIISSLEIELKQVKRTNARMKSLADIAANIDATAPTRK